MFLKRELGKLEFVNTMVTAAGDTRLLYRHQTSMHYIYTQIL